MVNFKGKIRNITNTPDGYLVRGSRVIRHWPKWYMYIFV